MRCVSYEELCAPFIAVSVRNSAVWAGQAMSPDGESIVTGAGDETLRFWNVFNKTRSTKVSFLPLFTSIVVR